MTVAARSAITTRFTSVLTEASPGLIIATDPNAAFEPPQNAVWARLAFADGDEVQVGMGGASNPLRTPLVAYADLFGPAGSGDGDVVSLAEVIKDGFRRWSAQLSVSETVRCLRFRSGVEGRGTGSDVALYRKQTIVVFSLAHRG